MKGNEATRLISPRSFLMESFDRLHEIVTLPIRRVCGVVDSARSKEIREVNDMKNILITIFRVLSYQLTAGLILKRRSVRVDL